MQDKLQELTSKLYDEGLTKGKQQGEKILADARKEAEAIISKAKEEAEDILAKAQKDATELKSKTKSDLKRASRECITATKQDVEKLVIAKIAEEPVKKALADADFIKEILKAVAEKFNSSEACDLEVVLPETLRTGLESFISSELSKVTKGGLSATFSKKINGGFTIGPKDGAYFISLTDETFNDLIAEYMRPTTRKLLFGE